MTRHKIGLAGFALGVSLLIVGCKGPWPAKTPKPKEKVVEHENSVVVMDQSLHDEGIVVTGQKSERTPDGRLKVTVEIKNETDKKGVLQVQTVFKDANNMPIDDQTNWEFIVLDPFAIYYYTATSFKTEASRYTVRISPRFHRK